MTGFALQVSLTDGSTRHLLGSTPQQRAEFEQMRDTWQDQPLTGFYSMKGLDGEEYEPLFVRDIADVRLVES